MKRTTFLGLVLLSQLCLVISPVAAKAKATDSKLKKSPYKATAKKAATPPVAAARTKAGYRTGASKPTASGPRRLVAYAPSHASLPRYTAPLSAGDRLGLNRTDNILGLDSNVALVLDEGNSEVLFSKNSDAVLPIASITKLMTALVVLEAKQDMDEILTVTHEDVDRIKHTSSRLQVGARLSRREMLHIALMSSENRAASALGRHFPGNLPAFVEAMNAQAALLGMSDTRYVEPTGLSSKNVSSARDLAKLVAAAEAHPLIKEFSTAPEHAVEPGGRALQYWNTNRLVRSSNWDIVLQKTGYIAEAGRCLVMKAMIEGRAVIMVFLDSKGKYSRVSDANRVRDWLEKAKQPALNAAAAESQG
jgi:serine-type D-Ala-D-Ala endopeptidase (penicillin-binding protein 7)